MHKIAHLFRVESEAGLRVIAHGFAPSLCYLSAGGRQGDEFALQEFFDALEATFPAQSGVLDTAEGSSSIGDATLVDSHHADLELLRAIEGMLQVRAKQITGETEVGVIGHGNGFFVAGRLIHGDNGPENFLLVHACGGGNVVQDGEREPTPLFRNLVLPDKLRSLIHRILDQLRDLFYLVISGQRTILRTFKGFGDLGHEVCVQVTVDDEAVGSDAHLACTTHLCCRRSLNSGR